MRTLDLVQLIAKGDRRSLLEALDQGAKIDGRTHGMTALHRAIETTRYDLAELLVERGADVDARYAAPGGSYRQWTPPAPGDAALEPAGARAARRLDSPAGRARG